MSVHIIIVNSGELLPKIVFITPMRLYYIICVCTTVSMDKKLKCFEPLKIILQRVNIATKINNGTYYK